MVIGAMHMMGWEAWKHNLAMVSHATLNKWQASETLGKE